MRLELVISISLYDLILFLTLLLGRSQFGGSGVPRRRPTRQNTYGGRSRSSTRYEGEEEEGYGSGDFEEGFELIRIKVKVSYFHTVIKKNY